MIAPLTALTGGPGEVRVGADDGDDAGVYVHDGQALVATADFITPVCDEPGRYGRVAAANALSDVWAMGGRPLFALNLCCFPGDLPDGVAAQILEGGAGALADADAALLGGHSVEDRELKYGMAVIGHADPDRLLTHRGARPGDQLVLTKPLGTGVLINAFKFDKLDAAGLEPAMVEMERLNDVACRLALEHGATAATDVTGFGIAGHALNIARGSGVTLAVDFDALPVHDGFYRLAKKGISTGCTDANRGFSEDRVRGAGRLSEHRRELLFDPQTSGGLLICVPEDRAPGLLTALAETRHRAAEIGTVAAGEPSLEIR